MELNERVHAYIAAKYYVYLKENFAERGQAAFRHATQYYAEQRGRRMAQRAIADGEALTFATYQKYGEWVNTEASKAEGTANRVETVSISPDYEVYVLVCPWHAQFRDMGLSEAGEAYCSDLDASICRGFNPYIRYETLQTLHRHTHCIQRVSDAGLSESVKPAKKEDGIRSFDYHCAHSYWSYRESCAGIFGPEGEEIAQKVLRDLEEDYGSEAADIIRGYEGTDFNVN